MCGLIEKKKCNTITKLHQSEIKHSDLSIQKGEPYEEFPQERIGKNPIVIVV